MSSPPAKPDATEPSAPPSGTPPQSTGPGAARPASLGASLREAREGAGLSAQEVAGRLRLTVSALHKLEAGSWETLGPPVYVRGYLRAYGRLVSVEIPELAGALPAGAPDPGSSPLAAPRALRRRRRSLERWKRVASYGLGTALVALPVVFFVTQAFEGSLFRPSPPEAPASLAVPSAEPQDGRAAADGPPLPIIASMTGLTARREAPAASASALLGSGFEVHDRSRAGAPAPAAEVTGSAMLELSLEEPVWVDIRDARGERLLYGTQAAGSVHRVPVAAGLQARLGNADGVTAELAGEPFDLAPHTRHNVADFRLAPADQAVRASGRAAPE